MFFNPKQHSPSLFMHFGVDQRGLLVPLLRKVRGDVVHVKNTIKMLSVRHKPSLRNQ